MISSLRSSTHYTNRTSKMSFDLAWNATVGKSMCMAMRYGWVGSNLFRFQTKLIVSGTIYLKVYRFQMMTNPSDVNFKKKKKNFLSDNAVSNIYYSSNLRVSFYSTVFTAGTPHTIPYTLRARSHIIFFSYIILL